jgi:hypothetical protein
MKVHDLYVALSQQNRKGEVEIKDGKIHVDGQKLDVKSQKEIRAASKAAEKKEKEKKAEVPVVAASGVAEDEEE